MIHMIVNICYVANFINSINPNLDGLFGFSCKIGMILSFPCRIFINASYFGFYRLFTLIWMGLFIIVLP